MSKQLKVGDIIYSNWDNPFYDDDFCVNTIEEIIVKNNETIIVTNDGDELSMDWLGIDFFTSKEDALNYRKKDKR